MLGYSYIYLSVVQAVKVNIGASCMNEYPFNNFREETIIIVSSANPRLWDDPQFSASQA